MPSGITPITVAGVAVDANRLAQHRGIAAVAVPPDVMTEHHDRLAAGDASGADEIAAEHRRLAQDRKRVRGHARRAHLIGQRAVDRSGWRWCRRSRPVPRTRGSANATRPARSAADRRGGRCSLIHVTMCSCADCSKGRPRKNAALTIVKPSVLAPMPRARTPITVAENQRSRLERAEHELQILQQRVEERQRRARRGAATAWRSRRRIESRPAGALHPEPDRAGCCRPSPCRDAPGSPARNRDRDRPDETRPGREPRCGEIWQPSHSALLLDG